MITWPVHPNEVDLENNLPSSDHVLGGEFQVIKSEDHSIQRSDSVGSDLCDPEALCDQQNANGEKVEAVREVKNATKRELWGVRIWKALFLLVALTTASLVTAGTYVILKDEEDKGYETSVSLYLISDKELGLVADLTPWLSFFSSTSSLLAL